MNFKKLINLFLLGSFLLAQIPQVWGMEPNNNQNQAGSRYEYSLRDRRNLERRLQKSRHNALLTSLFGTVGTVLFGSTAKSMRALYYKYPEIRHHIGSDPSASIGSMGLCCFVLPCIVAWATFKNKPENSLNLTPLVRNAVQPVKQTAEWLALTFNSSNVDARDAQGMTKLMRAARNNSSSLAQLAVTCGANADAKDADRKNALMHAIDADDVEIVRMLLLFGAKQGEAHNYVSAEISRCESDVAALGLAVDEVNEHSPTASRLQEKNGELTTLQEMQTLFSQTPAQLLAPLTSAQKAEYKKMFAGREQVKPSLHGSLMLYEHFDDATALKKYLKVKSQIHQGIANKRNGMQDFMPHIMSFLRTSAEKTQLRLDDALCKARLEDNQELSELLQLNGAALDENKFYDAHINKQFWQ